MTGTKGDLAALKPCPCCGTPCEADTTPAWDHHWTDKNGVPQRTHHHAMTRYKYRTGQLVPVPSVERVATVKENLTDEALDKPVNLEVVQWQGRLHSAYMNDFRIAGGKPWGGGQTAKTWTTSLREIIRAFPELQKALGLNYLGRPATAVIAAMKEGRDG